MLYNQSVILCKIVFAYFLNLMFCLIFFYIYACGKSEKKLNSCYHSNDFTIPIVIDVKSASIERQPHYKAVRKLSSSKQPTNRNKNFKLYSNCA